MGAGEAAARGWLAHADRWSTVATRAVAVLAVAGMLVISLLTIADVLLRLIANRPIAGFNEFAELALATIIAACFPRVLAARRNLSVDFLDAMFSNCQRAILAAVGGVLGTLFVAILAWRVAIHAQGLSQRDAATVILLLPMAPFW